MREYCPSAWNRPLLAIEIGTLRTDGLIPR
jgi:hypothetical protein